MIQALARRRKPRGQALVEYAVAIMMISSVFFVIDLRIRKSIGKLWKALAKDIAAGCAGCEPPDAVR